MSGVLKCTRGCVKRMQERQLLVNFHLAVLKSSVEVGGLRHNNSTFPIHFILNQIYRDLVDDLGD